MRLSQLIDRTSATRRKSGTKRRKASVVMHKSFVPMLTAWGAALFGLAVSVLPADMIANLAINAGLAGIGIGAKWALALAGAQIGGILAFAAAVFFRSRKRASDDSNPIITTYRSRRIKPINPTSDLGSESLDAPIEAMPFGADDAQDLDRDPQVANAVDGYIEGGNIGKTKVDKEGEEATLGEMAERGYEDEIAIKHKRSSPDNPAIDDSPAFSRRDFQAALIETCEGASCEAAATLKQSSARDQHTDRPDLKEVQSAKPRALDLAEFATIPGRNAVWVEEDNADLPPGISRSDHTKASRSRSAPSALEKLRQTPTDQLSIVHMVERFAAALHDHQENDRKSPQNAAGDSHRDAALAEALKALSLFTDHGFDTAGPSSLTENTSGLSETERDLRDALAKLQTLRGAA